MSLHVITPVIPSHSLSLACGHKVFLKLDNLQPSGSFKVRGIGHFIQKNENIKHVVNSSGGNAGMATSYAAKICGLPATIVIPESTPKMMISRLEDEGAEVLVHGNIWDEANEKALKLGKQEGWCYVHPYDHPIIHEGHSTIVSELKMQMQEKPSVIVVSVGGGGLLSGILIGLKQAGWEDVQVVAMETQGAHCYNAALKAGKPVSIGNITSIAKTLGALTVTSEVFKLMDGLKVISKVVDDKLAVDACLKFIDDHRMLVEPSCGATLSAGYSGIIKQLFVEGELNTTNVGPIVFIVCGGSAVTLDLLDGWKKQFSL